MLERFFPSRTAKSGLPPGSIVHLGEKPEKKPCLSFTQYSGTSLTESPDVSLGLCPTDAELRPVTWIHLDGLHNTDLITQLGTRYDFHSLVLEDIVNTGHRPKLEELEDYIYIVIKSIDYDEQSEEVVPSQVNILFNRSAVFSFQESGAEFFTGIKRRLRNDKGKIRKKAGDYLAYALLDTIVDNYFAVVEKVGDRLENLEDAVLAHSAGSAMEEIHAFKLEVDILKRSIWPLREVVSHLEKLGRDFIEENNTKYFRDLYDHIIHLIDMIEILRDRILSLRDLNLAMISNKMNEIMKVLTVISTIFIPLTFIAGIYGMKFKYMPELEWRWGYFAVIAAMFACAAAMGLYFRTRKWM